MMNQQYIPCEVCGGRATDHHHVFNGPNRKHSETYGLVQSLCRRCHDRMHADQLFWNRYREEYQRLFEALHGHEKFMSIFGQNYLEEAEWKHTTL